MRFWIQFDHFVNDLRQNAQAAFGRVIKCKGINKMDSNTVFD